nr:hypothetical protein LVJ77_04650 [Conchiformibius kuhniae]
MMKMKIKCGKRRLDIPRLQQIAAVFGMDAADLMTVDTGAVLLARNNRLKDVKQSVVCLMNKDSPSHHTYYNGAEALLHEIETLKLQLAHQGEIMRQQQQQCEALTAAQQREIDLLRGLLASLQAQ